MNREIFIGCTIFTHWFEGKSWQNSSDQSQRGKHTKFRAYLVFRILKSQKYKYHNKRISWHMGSYGNEKAGISTMCCLVAPEKISIWIKCMLLLAQTHRKISKNSRVKSYRQCRNTIHRNLGGFIPFNQEDSLEKIPYGSYTIFLKVL